MGTLGPREVGLELPPLRIRFVPHSHWFVKGIPLHGHASGFANGFDHLRSVWSLGELAPAM